MKQYGTERRVILFGGKGIVFFLVTVSFGVMLIQPVLGIEYPTKTIEILFRSEYQTENAGGEDFPGFEEIFWSSELFQLCHR